MKLRRLGLIRSALWEDWQDFRRSRFLGRVWYIFTWIAMIYCIGFNVYLLATGQLIETYTSFFN